MRLSLATKIFLVFTAQLFIFVVLAVVSVRQIRDGAEDLRAIKEGKIALARKAARLEVHQNNRFRDLRNLADSDARTQGVLLSIGIKYFPERIQQALDDLRDVARTQAKKPSDKAAAHLSAQVNLHADRLQLLHGRVDRLTAEGLQRVLEGKPLGRLERLESLQTSIELEFFQLNSLIDTALGDAVRRAEKDERAAVWSMVAMTGVALCVGVFLTLLAARALSPIAPLVRYARAISRGDYEQEVNVRGDDELSSLADELQQMARSRKDREDELDRQTRELKTAYSRIEDLKRYHERVVRSLRTAVVVTDRELQITSTNRAAETQWGLSSVDVTKRLPEIELGRLLAGALGPLEEQLKRADVTQLDALAFGDRRADITVAPLENENAEVLGLVVALEDVTETVRTKEALIRSERLAAIGRMSAHVTHEIRNPLSSIGLNAEMLEDHVKDAGPDGRELCQAIVREVDRLTAITEEYLRFARLPRPHLKPVALQTFLQPLAAFIRRDLDAAKVELKLELDEDLPDALIDPDQMRQAVLNLMRNAKESMPQGGLMTLSTERTEGGVQIVVADEGVGINEEDLPRVFDPFYSTKLTGTGLGLALCHQIITEHGGEIAATSVLKEGTRVALKLLTAPAADQAVAS